MKFRELLVAQLSMLAPELLLFVAECSLLEHQHRGRRPKSWTKVRFVIEVRLQEKV